MAKEGDPLVCRLLNHGKHIFDAKKQKAASKKKQKRQQIKEIKFRPVTEKNDYEIKQGDIEDGFDANDILQVKDFLKDVDAVISAGPFAVNKNIASVSAEEGIGYFDLTEDVETTEYIRSLKSENILMPQCGLAPGAINICASGMMEQFDTVNEVLMRVGALPRFTTNEMSYYLSWSTNGLINEYCNDTLYYVIINRDITIETCDIHEHAIRVKEMTSAKSRLLNI